MPNSHLPREGDLYKKLQIGQSVFHIHYGYYSDQERALGEPIPILPDLLLSPTYTTEGHRITTHIQDACHHYRPRESISNEDWCADCIHYLNPQDEISVCLCADMKLQEETL